MRVPELSRALSAGPGRPGGSLPAVQRVGSYDVRDSPSPQAPHRPSGGVRGDAEANTECLYSLTFGEAPCIGIVGDRGTGKSTAMRSLCRQYLRRSVGLVLACDKDGASKFQGQTRVDVSDLAARPMASEPRSVVFVGDLYSGIDPDPERVARFAWLLAARRVPSLLAVDELKWAAKGGWWRKDVIWLRQSCSEGRKHGVGVLWASQSPQDAPREAFEEAGAILCYRLAGLGLALLLDRGYLNGIDPAVVESLPGDDSPPAKRGQAVLLRRGRPWDGRFYRFDP
jgi:energy-coupling factor transporter ATP-binding protein EcfA2